jgi:hypothetical protein
MNDFDNSLPHLGKLLAERLAVVGTLADSLEASRLAFRRNDAEAIARGAAHQAELCRQWSRLEDRLRAQAAQRLKSSPIPAQSIAGYNSDAARSTELAVEWDALSARIRYLTRVHRSLLRHMQRSLAVWNHIVASGALTYSPPCGLSREMPVRAGG